MRRGRKTNRDQCETIRWALAHLDDPYALHHSEFAQTRVVQAHAERVFPRRACALGLSASAVLHNVLQEIATDLQAHRTLSTFAGMLDEGRSQVAIAKSLSISASHLTRRWKPALLKVVHERLQLLNREVAELAEIA